MLGGSFDAEGCDRRSTGRHPLRRSSLGAVCALADNAHYVSLHAGEEPRGLATSLNSFVLGPLLDVVDTAVDDALIAEATAVALAGLRDREK